MYDILVITVVFFVNDFELKKCDFDGISYANIGINIHG